MSKTISINSPKDSGLRYPQYFGLLLRSRLIQRLPKYLFFVGGVNLLLFLMKSIRHSNWRLQEDVVLVFSSVLVFTALYLAINFCIMYSTWRKPVFIENKSIYLGNSNTKKKIEAIRLLKHDSNFLTFEIETGNSIFREPIIDLYVPLNHPKEDINYLISNFSGNSHK